MIGVGDLVVCVDASHNTLADAPSGLVEGRNYIVTGIVESWEGTGLHVDWMVPPEPFLGWHSNRFRKVQQDKREACEEEFRILLKLSKQRVSA